MTSATLRLVRIAVLSAALLALMAVPAQAATFNVTKTADTNDGTCDSDCSLREAVNAANALSGADAVNVPAGVYTLTVAAGGQLRVMDHLTLTGAGAGSTTVSGGGLVRVLRVDSGKTVDVSRLTVTDGSAPLIDPGGAPLFAGGILNLGKLTLTDTTVSDNLAVLGAGIFSVDTLSITNSEISGNVGFVVGGILDVGNTLTVTNSTVTGNNSFVASGIATGGSNATLSRTTVSRNPASLGIGGILNDSGTLTVDNSTVSGNDAAAAIGGIANGGGPLTVTRSTVSDNDAGVIIGGIYNDDVMTLENATVSDNDTAGLVGGIANDGGTMTLRNATVTGNDAAVLGGGILNGGDDTYLNTIVANNQAPTFGNCLGNATSADHSLDSSDECGFGTSNGNLENTDPKLGGLANNGGPTLTHALLDGSPAIDTANNANCPATDQRGGARPQPPGGVCDIGAFEAGALADLAVTKVDSPDPVTVGSNLTYTVTVTNNGPDRAAGVKLDDVIPAGTSFVSASSTLGPCAGTNVVTCGLGTLESGASAQTTIVVRPSSTGTITNTANVRGNPTDTVPGNDNATATTTVVAPAAGRLRRGSARIAGVPRACVSRNFVARVRIRSATRLRSVRVFLDGKLIKRTRRSSFRVRVPARRLRAGRHRLRVVAIDRAGRRIRQSKRFVRCARAKRRVPRFTG